MSSPAEKGQALVRQAEKKATSGGGFFGSMFSNPTEKFIQAAQLYGEAAIQFKIAKQWKESADAYMKAAELQNKGEQPHEAATSFVEASTVLKKVSNEEALRAMEAAADVYQNMGRFAMAAKQFKSIAELYENQVVDLDKALHFYQQAVDAYDADGSSSSSDKLRIKLAHISAQKEKFEEAYTIYEEVAGRMMENNLLKFSTKEYFLKAGLCRLCMGDAIAARRAAENYVLQNPQFADSREHKLLVAVTDSVEEGDTEKYTEAVREFDTIQKLDAWMTSILLRIKKGMDGEEDIL